MQHVVYDIGASPEALRRSAQLKEATSIQPVSISPDNPISAPTRTTAQQILDEAIAGGEVLTVDTPSGQMTVLALNPSVDAQSLFAARLIRYCGLGDQIKQKKVSKYEEQLIEIESLIANRGYSDNKAIVEAATMFTIDVELLRLAWKKRKARCKKS